MRIVSSAEAATAMVQRYMRVIRHAIRYLLISIAALFALVLVAFAALWWSSIPPSDASLQRQFVAHRADLDRLIAMMNEDNHMTRIASDFTWKDDNLAWPRPQSQRGITAARWDEYRALFLKARVKHGTSREEKSCDIELIVWTWGLVTGGMSTSYVHCGTPTNDLVHTQPACLAHKDAGTFSDDKEDYRYKRLTEGWYLSEERN